MAFAKLKDHRRAWELWSLINPVSHAGTPRDAAVYKLEPYVVAADVYSVAPHVGRGGWTWYTGSAGWMYRAGIEAILGFRVHGEFLRMDPCIPRDWAHYEIRFKHRSARYEIAVENPERR